MRTILTVLLLPVLTTISLAGEQLPPALDLTSVAGFARHLFESGEYELAASEYQRLLFLSDCCRDSILFMAGRSYLLAGRPRESHRFFLQTIKEQTSGPFARPAWVRLAYGSFLLSEYDQVHTCLKPASALPAEDSAHQFELPLLDASAWAHQLEWGRAKDVLAQRNGEAFSAKNIRVLHAMDSLVSTAVRMKRKKPVLAGVMSAAVPGLGRLYAGRAVDALTTAISVSSSGRGAYVRFRDRGVADPLGWLLAGLCAYFYSGNVYGSVHSCQVENDLRAQSILKEIDQQVHLLFSP